MGGMHGLLLFLGSELIWTIALVQVTALIIAAFRQSNRTLVEMEREDQDHELLRLPSDSSRSDPFATLETRSMGSDL